MTRFKKVEEKGWSYPFTFHSGGVRRSTEGLIESTEVSTTDIRRHIRMSVEQILLTGRGQRVMRRNFGSQLSSLLWEPIRETSVTSNIFAKKIQDALIMWEPRINLKSVTMSRFDPTEGVIAISVVYEIPGIITSDTYNLDLNTMDLIG